MEKEKPLPEILFETACRQPAEEYVQQTSI